MPTDEAALAKEIVDGVDADAVSRMEWEGNVQAALVEKIDIAALPEGSVITLNEAQTNGYSVEQLEANWFWRDWVTGRWVKRSQQFFVEQADVREALVQQKRDAEIILASAVLSVSEHLPPQGMAPYSAIAPNGVAHSKICSMNGPPGGDKAAWTHPTAAAAVAEWKRKILEYAATTEGDTLWWRTPPEIDGQLDPIRNKVMWLVYSRLTIGNLADTYIERVKRGDVFPAQNDINNGLITADQVAELGLTEYDVCTDRWYPPGFDYSTRDFNT